MTSRKVADAAMSTKKPAGPGRRLRAVFGAIGWSTVVAVLGAISFVFALYQAGYFHRLAGRFLERQLERFTHTDCELGAVTGNLVTGVVISGVVIGNGPSIVKDGVAIGVEQLDVSYRPWKLLSRSPVIDRAVAFRPRVFLQKDPKGGVNLGRIFGPKKKTGKPDRVSFEITEAVVRDGYFRMGLDTPLHDFTEIQARCLFTKAPGVFFLDLGDCSCYLPEYGQKLPHFGSGGLAISKNRVRFSSLDVSTASTHVVVSGVIKTRPETYLDLRFDADRLDFGEVGQGLFRDPPQIYGRGYYSGTLVGPPDELVQAGVVTIKSGYAYGFRLSHVFAYYTYDVAREEVSVEGVQGQINDTSLDGRVTVNFATETPFYWGRVRVLRLNLGEYLKNDAAATDLDATVVFNGTGVKAPQMDFKAAISLGPGKLGPIRIDGGTADIHYDRGRLNVLGVGVAAGGGDLNVKGTVGEGRMDFSVAAEALPFDRLVYKKDLRDLDLSITGTATVTGTGREVKVTGDVRGEAVRYGPVSFEGVQVEGEWTAGEREGLWDVTVKGWDGAAGPLRLDGLQARVTGREGVYKLAEGEIEVNGSPASFAGSYDRLRGRAELTHFRMSLERGDAILDAPLVLERRGGDWVLEGGSIRYAGGDVALNGRYDGRTKAITGAAEARNIPVSDLLPEKEYLRAEGLMNRLRVDVAGTSEKPSFYAHLAASNLTINGESLDYLHAEASFEDGVVVIPGLTAGAAGGTVRATAYLPLAAFDPKEVGNVDATLWFSRFGVKAANAAIGKNIFDGGYVDGVVTVTGNGRQPVVRASLLLSELRREDVVFAKGRVDAEYRDGALTLSEFSLSEKAVPNVIATGHFPLGPGGAEGKELALRLDLADFDLRALNLLTKEVLITGGRVRGRMEAGGTYEAPEITGSVAIADGQGFARALRSSFGGLYGRVMAAGRSLTVERENPLTFKLDEGTGEVWGRLDFTQGREPRVNLTAEVGEYVVRALPGVQAKCDLTLAVAGPVDKLNARAEVRVKEGLILYDVGAPVSSSAAAGPDFEVHVTAPGAVWLRTRDANIELELDVTVRSVAGNRYYLGELKARRGHYYFLGRDFAIDRAVITLTGTSELDPIIDLSASRVIRGAGAGGDDVIRINVTGSMRRPDVELVYEAAAGEGALPSSQDEILKLLVLDMTKRDYDALAGGSAVAGRETDYLGRYAEAEVARAVRRGTGLDVFQFESNVLYGAGGDPYAEFTVGQHLSKDVFVSYTGKYRENALGARSLAHAAEIDYELARNLFVVGSTYNDEGLQRYGLGLRFIHKY